MSSSARDQPSQGRSHIGPRGPATGGMASAADTPAMPGFGQNANNSKDDASKGMATQPKMFDAAGPVGRQFTTEGVIGGAAQAVGGPLAEDGMVGRQFTEGGSVGGTVQKVLGGEKEVS